MPLIFLLPLLSPPIPHGGARPGTPAGARAPHVNRRCGFAISATPQALQRPVGGHSRGRFPAGSTMAYFPEAVNHEIASRQENVSFAL